jgi:nucleoside-specific outer membrane channel protein Tsx
VTHLHPRRLATLAALALALLPVAARAQFATTNIQVLDGWNFHDPSVGEDVKGGQMSTVTVNHFSTWKLGDNFFFVDMMQGDFKNGDGSVGVKSKLYGEIHPRLFLNPIIGTKGNTLGIFKNWGIATELNVGNGFQAYLAGLGVDFAVPHGNLGLNVYYRYDQFQSGTGFNSYNHTWQVSPFWTFPFQLGNVPFLFTGFLDWDGQKAGKGWKGYEVMTQPELLVDVLAPFGGTKNVLYAGVEWYLHYHPNNEKFGASSNTISAPQAMIQVNLH